MTWTSKNIRTPFCTIFLSLFVNDRFDPASAAYFSFALLRRFAWFYFCTIKLRHIIGFSFLVVFQNKFITNRFMHFFSLSVLFCSILIWYDFKSSSLLLPRFSFTSTFAFSTIRLVLLTIAPFSSVLFWFLCLRVWSVCICVCVRNRGCQCFLRISNSKRNIRIQLWTHLFWYVKKENNLWFVTFVSVCVLLYHLNCVCK